MLLGGLPLAAAAPAPLVAFACDTSGSYDLFVMRLDGSGLTQVTDGPRADTGPAWSPDGTRVAFWSTLLGRSELTVVDLASGVRRTLPVDVQVDGPHRLFPPDWSPDGRWVVFESNRDGSPTEARTDLYLIRPDGSDLRRLTADDALTAAPSWTPDGRKVLFSRQFGGADGTSFPELFVRTADGRSEERLTSDEWHDWDATVAPAGGSIAFTSNRGGPAGGTTFRIHLRHPRGAIRPITAGAERSAAFSPSWTPDGRSIVYAYDPDGSLEPSVGYFGGADLRIVPPGPAPSRIHVARVDGSADRALTDGSASCVTPDVLTL